MKLLAKYELQRFPDGGNALARISHKSQVHRGSE
jgi:hypothetical protein